MARGLTLEKLLYNLRVEIGQSTNTAVSRSTRTRFIGLLNSYQRLYWYKHDWSFLEIKRDKKMQAGSRYYDFPDDMDMDRAHKLEYKLGSDWCPVAYGIGGEQYSELDSDNDMRLDPVLRWNYYIAPITAANQQTVPQFEVWPIPATDGNDTTLDGYVRWHGYVKCREMVNDSDVCLLDGDLITFLAAAEILAKLKSADAPAKLEKGNQLFNTLKTRATPATKFKIGQDADPDQGKKIVLRAVYNKTP